MFIMIGGSIAGDGSQSGIRSFGIGFLGGVILKDGFNIRGMNTATLWCTAAIGTLAGWGTLDSLPWEPRAYFRPT